MKISYNKRWDNNGYCYTQNVRISKLLFKKINDSIRLEIENQFPRINEYASDEYKKLYLNILELQKDVAFLKLTQLKFICKFILIDSQIKLDRNTCLVVD